MPFTRILTKCGHMLFGSDHSIDTLQHIYEHNFLPEIRKFLATGKSEHMVMDGMIDCKLSQDEAFLILAYSSHLGKWINAAYRGLNTPSECMKEVAFALNQALTKMPTYGLDVFRMNLYVADEQEELTWFKSKVGKTFNVPFFLSTSKENWKNCKVVWKIQTLSEDSFGKDISRLCQVPSEKEVLFMQNVKFLISDVDVENATIYLSEQMESSVFDFPLIGAYTKNY